MRHYYSPRTPPELAELLEGLYEQDSLVVLETAFQPVPLVGYLRDSPRYPKLPTKVLVLSRERFGKKYRSLHTDWIQQVRTPEGQVLWSSASANE